MKFRQSVPQASIVLLTAIASLSAIASTAKAQQTMQMSIKYPTANTTVPTNTQTITVTGTVKSLTKTPAPPTSIQVVITAATVNAGPYNGIGGVSTPVPGTKDTWNYSIAVMIGMGGMPKDKYTCQVTPLDGQGNKLLTGTSVQFASGP